MIKQEGVDLIPVHLRPAEEDIHDDNTHIDSNCDAEVDDRWHDGTAIVSGYCQHYCSDGCNEQA